ncbi:Beta-barrel assembly machine subunit BamE [Rhodoferax sp. OV413]|uniref:outer membrane protein assembly factor BamE n=1 Tax=Rhodoferax sp. OV413 TaxID=1855285 RepID=UPI00087F4EF3|nr:outer membrane protein assembly factor BamE [Rhodoferax sp. OV413]SDO85912.1 Beta-barrel assembly machine subunit BamE [Rhodoferax sp. OV413]
MFAPFLRGTGTALTLAVCATLVACSGLDNRTRSFVSSLSPYQIEVVQGNFVSKEQVDALKPGMAREQVKDILGTSLLQDVFHGDRWDYVFTLRRQGTEPQARQLTVFFKGDVLDRVEGDTMPSESEFVSLLAKTRSTKAVPVLEADESRLKSFPAPAPVAAASAPQAPVATAYPPLEAPAP